MSSETAIPPVLPAHEDDACIPDDASSTTGSQSEEGEVLDGFQASPNDSDSTQGKDSGIECTPEIVARPDEETAKKILDLVEFYFSDANVLKDPFLLKHVKRNKEGYVSLKLISSFRKIKSMCKDWQAVAEIISTSKLLVINKEGTKVRRVAPLPNYDETVTSRTLIVCGLLTEKLTVENLSDMFSKYGDIALVRVLRPGSSVSQDVRKFLSKHPEIQSGSYGIVEFEEFAGAKKALLVYIGNENGIRVLPIRMEKTDSKNQGGKNISSNQKNLKPENPKRKKPQKIQNGSRTGSYDGNNSQRRCSSDTLGNSAGSLSSSPGENWFNRRHSYNPGGSQVEFGTSSFSSLNNRYKGSKERLAKAKQDNESCSDSTAPSSPWRQRRNIVRTELSQSLTSLATPVPISRLPRGPDSSTGFQCNRKQLPSTAE